MPTLGDTIELTVRDDCTLAELEELIAERLQAVGRTLLVAACAAAEGKVLQDQAHGLQPNKRRPRDLLTRFGWIRLDRWSCRTRTTGQYRYPLDEALAIEPHQHASPWVMAKAVTLAGRLSYRDATKLLAEVLGVEVDHRTVWGWVQDTLRNDPSGKAAQPANGHAPESTLARATS